MSSAKNVQGAADKLAEGAGDTIRQLGNKVESNLQDAGASVAKAQKLMEKQARIVADAADEYVHENPWRSIAVAGAAGLLIGLLFNIRR